MDSAKKLTIEERIELHRRMAEGYRDAYAAQGVSDGGGYESWKFADDALYSSPYFIGDEVLTLRETSIQWAESAAMEAKAYSLKFPDWKPKEFKCWPADNGFVMRTRWEGHTKEDVKMGFYSIGFVDTNDEGLITRWETFVNDDEYGPFLEVALGVRGPFKGKDQYHEALTKALAAA